MPDTALAMKEPNAPPTPQNRLAQLQRAVPRRCAAYWEPNACKRSGALPFREKHQLKVTVALVRQNPIVTFPTVSYSFRKALVVRARWGDRNAIRSLGQLGFNLTKFPEVRKAFDDIVPTLIARAKRKDYNAIRALGELDASWAELPDGRETLDMEYPEVRKFLDDSVEFFFMQDDENEDGDSIRALGRLGVSVEYPDAWKAFNDPDLVDKARLGDGKAIRALGEMGSRLAELSDVKEALNDTLPVFVPWAKQGDGDAIEALDKICRWRWRFFDTPDLLMKHVQDLAKGNHSIRLRALDHRLTIFINDQLGRIVQELSPTQLLVQFDDQRFETVDISETTR